MNNYSCVCVKERVLKYLMEDLLVPQDMIDTNVPLSEFEEGAEGVLDIIVNVVVIFGTTLLSTLSLRSAYTVYVPASRFLIRSGSPSPLVVAVTASIDNAPFEFTNALLVFAATPATPSL